MDNKKDCKGCLWYSECHKAIRCELYDGSEEDEDNYVWSEMGYNENIILENENLKDSYERGDMEDWFNTVGKLS